MQHHNTNWHFHSASPCPVFCGFSTRHITRHASASSLSHHDYGRCLRASEHVYGGRASMSWPLTPLCQLLVPSSLDPWSIFNYPICAVLTVGSETQLWEANKRADLEKERLYSDGPWGFKGHYIGERLAGLKALAILLPSVFAHHVLLFWNSSRNTDASVHIEDRSFAGVCQILCFPLYKIQIW